MGLPRFRRLRLLTVLALVALGVERLRRAAARARSVPLSPLTAGWRVGADYPERRGIVVEGEVAGEMDDMDEYAGPEFDPAAVNPAVRAFYERTADHELAYEAAWHRPFRLGAALAGRVTSRVEQLDLPGPGESGVRELNSRFARVDPTADPREGARAWVRTREDGGAVFVALYATHERDAEGVSKRERKGRRYVNIAVPLPGANLSTVLRPENLDGGGIELTTLDEVSDEGLYLVTRLGAIELPLDQRFRVWPADSSDRDAPTADRSDSVAPADFSRGRASVVATHEMWLFGWRFLTVRYASWPGRKFRTDRR